MAEEEATPVAPPAAPTTTTEQNGGEAADTAAAADKGKKKHRNNRDDDVPVEELFDLSKPIPRVSKKSSLENKWPLFFLSWIHIQNFLQLKFQKANLDDSYYFQPTI